MDDLMQNIFVILQYGYIKYGYYKCLNMDGTYIKTQLKICSSAENKVFSCITLCVF